MHTTLKPTQVTEYADALEAAGIFRSCEYRKEVLAGVGYYDLELVWSEMHRRDVVRKIEAFTTTPAIKAFMLSFAATAQRGLHAPRAVDMSRFAQSAKRTTDQYHKPVAPWAPKGACGLVMKLKEGVGFTHTQESYSDDSTTLIPVEGDLSKADLAMCQANVGSFFKCADTHTGMAGSGCNWSASVMTNEHGAFIHVHCRASIAD